MQRSDSTEINQLVKHFIDRDMTVVKKDKMEVTTTIRKFNAELSNVAYYKVKSLEDDYDTYTSTQFYGDEESTKIENLFYLMMFMDNISIEQQKLIFDVTYPSAVFSEAFQKELDKQLGNNSFKKENIKKHFNQEAINSTINENNLIRFGLFAGAAAVAASVVVAIAYSSK